MGCYLPWYMVKDFIQLREQLSRLLEEGYIIGLKTGTEIEDMSFEEIKFLRELSEGIVPLTVKIGGVEARNDIRQCFDMKIDTILAPMAETVYAISNFVETVKDIAKEKKQELPALAMNLESITAYNNLNDIIQSLAFKDLSQVTIGRGDFSKSMQLNVNDEEVLWTTANALKRLKKNKKMTSVGGGITIQNIAIAVEKLPTDKFNTRHISFPNGDKLKSDPKVFVYKALKFEQDLYHVLKIEFPFRKDYYQKRYEILNNRLGSINLLQKES